MKLPTFFVIGAMKAGTTSLHAYLDQHPDIHMSRIKEPHFFARPADGPYSHRIDELADYEKLFESSAIARGESSPTYSLYPRCQEVPKRISALVPDAKLIYLVRNPIDRIVSHYMHNVAIDGVRKSFADQVGDLADLNNPYIYACLYATQMEQYLRVFDRNQILVIDQAELLSSQSATLRTIFRFLRVDTEYDMPLLQTKYGTSEDRRQFPARYLRFADRVSSSPLRLFPRSGLRSARRLVERTLWPSIKRPVVGDEIRRQVARACAPDVARLREYTGKEFSTWGV